MKNLDKNTLQTHLNKAYTKRFKQLNKKLIDAPEAGLLLFIEHLRYLRDCQIINGSKKPSVKSKVSSLNVAITEFEMYQESKKEFHWRNFCEFVKLNMGEWLKLNDSV